MINNKQLETLNKCLISTNDDLKEYIISFCKQNGYEILERKKYLFGYLKDSKLNIMLTAHYDVVHEKKVDSEVFYDNKHQVFWSPNGLGADDRTGIFIILNQIETQKPRFLLFTDEEEKGGLGGEEFCKDFTKKIDTNLFIALDRRGHKNFVTYDDDNQEVEKLIKSYGFEKEHGSFTDICRLMEEFDISGVNLSVGYENNHTFTETLRINNMEYTMSALDVLLKDEALNTKYVFTKKKYEPYIYQTREYGYNKDGIYRIWNSATQKFDIKQDIAKNIDKQKETNDIIKQEVDVKDQEKPAIEFNSPNNCAKFDIPKHKARDIGSCEDCLFALECKDNFTALNDFCIESGISKDEAYGNGNCSFCINIHDCYPGETCVMNDMFIIESFNLNNCEKCNINCSDKKYVDNKVNKEETIH